MASSNGAAARGREALDDAERAVVRGARRAKAAGREAIDTIEETTEMVRHRGETMVHDLEALVARRPIASVLVAAGAGYLLAKLWR
ncbi:MAG: hypothetical protein ACWA6X_04850 [Bauldia sp.]|jgi:ElaB/YqjD/DUF883 family membrane-anchored ribosome-binding protein